MDNLLWSAESDLGSNIYTRRYHLLSNIGDKEQSQQT